jgi:hypothetical protein
MPAIDGFARVLTVCRVMLQDVFDRLVTLGLGRVWVGYEVHVDVASFRYAIADKPLRVRERGSLRDARLCSNVREVFRVVGVAPPLDQDGLPVLDR